MQVYIEEKLALLMGDVINYIDIARSSERVFRNVLRGLLELHIGNVEPEDLEMGIDGIFDKYSSGNRYGKFTINDFKRGPYRDPLFTLTIAEAVIETSNVACLSGHRRTDKFLIRSNESVEFLCNLAFSKY